MITGSSYVSGYVQYVLSFHNLIALPHQFPHNTCL